MVRSLSRLSLVLVAALMLGACDTTQEFQRGYQIDEKTVAQVKPKMSADQVLNALGSPSTVSTVGNRTWYYISQTAQRRFQFMEDRIVDQRVLAVYFDSGLRVERVALYGLQDGKVFDFISRTTPTGGGDQSFVGQLFKGLGGSKFMPFGN